MPNNNFRKNPKDKNTKKRKTVPAKQKVVKKDYIKAPDGKTGPAYEYSMTRTSANDILKDAPSTAKPQEYLCNFVTEQFHLKGYCVNVIIED